MCGTDLHVLKDDVPTLTGDALWVTRRSGRPSRLARGFSFAIHRFDLDGIMTACDAFSDAAKTTALKVVLSASLETHRVGKAVRMPYGGRT